MLLHLGEIHYPTTKPRGSVETAIPAATSRHNLVDGVMAQCGRRITAQFVQSVSVDCFSTHTIMRFNKWQAVAQSNNDPKVIVIQQCSHLRGRKGIQPSSSLLGCEGGKAKGVQ